MKRLVCRRGPATALGVVFVTLEDETGIVNLVIWRDTFERFRSQVRLSTAMRARGRTERRGRVLHLHVNRVEPLDRALAGLEWNARNFH